VVTVGSEVRKTAGGSEKAKLTVVRTGSAEFTVLTLSSTGKHPEPEGDANRLTVGGQTVLLDDGCLRLEKFEK
jgi:hypothetical protein